MLGFCILQLAFPWPSNNAEGVSISVHAVLMHHSCNLRKFILNDVEGDLMWCSENMNDCARADWRWIFKKYTQSWEQRNCWPSKTHFSPSKSNPKPSNHFALNSVQIRMNFQVTFSSAAERAGKFSSIKYSPNFSREKQKFPLKSSKIDLSQWIGCLDWTFRSQYLRD
jgi:hypothetical protein